MNKKAISDSEVQDYKMEKEEPIGTSHMGTSLILAFILVTLLLIVIIGLCVFFLILPRKMN